MIISVDLNNPDKKIVTVIANFIKAREIVILPTDTIYGIACDATNDEAVKRVRRIMTTPKSLPGIISYNKTKKLKRG